MSRRLGLLSGVYDGSLPSPSYRTVRVAGVEVEMFEDWKPSRIAPMKVSLAYWDETGDLTAEEVTRLHLAGVTALPLYESEAFDAGIKWEET
jgi:hypothetical protein